MFQGGLFMIITRTKFYGYQLKQKIMPQEINPFLFKAFCNSISSFPDDIDEETFFDYMEYNYELIDKICFFYLVSNLGNAILTKNPSYIAELCTSITMKDISFQKYIPITLYLLSEPIYSLITQIDEFDLKYGYITLFDFIINIINKNQTLNIGENEQNEILKTLNDLLDNNYSILFKPTDTLEDIFTTIYQKMQEINKKNLTFKASDFKKISFLMHLSHSDNEALKNALTKELIASEKGIYDSKQIIKHCLEIIEKYRHEFIAVSLVRRLPYEK